MKKERNCDKIKRLEREIRSERERRRNANLEIMRMHKVVDMERNNASMQLAEVSTLADGLLAALALHKGANIGDGWELAIPVYSPTELCGRYSVKTDRAGEFYVIRAEEKRDGEETV